MAVEISATLKGGPGYDAPWLVVRVENADHTAAVEELDKALELLREVGAFSAVQTIAGEFKDAPKGDAAVAAIKAAFPGATEVKDTTPAPRPAAPAAPVKQGIPPCPTCGRARKHKTGISPKTGKWAGFFCESQDNTHTEWLPV